MTTKSFAYILRGYPDLMTRQDVQEALRLGESKVFALLRSGEIHSLRIGREYRVPKAYLIEYLERCSRTLSPNVVQSEVDKGFCRREKEAI